MSQRVTRSRGNKLVIPDEEQPRIRDHFNVTRNRRTATKKLIETSVVQTVVKNEAEDVIKPVKSVSKRVRRNLNEAGDSAEIVLPESSVPAKSEVIDVTNSLPQSPPRRARKTPTPNSSPISKASNARKTLFIDKAPECSSEAGLECPVMTITKKPATKIRTVAQLQATLAEKGALRKLHQQNTENKSRQVEEHVNLLKSPVKAVPKGYASEKVIASANVSPLKKASYSKRIERPVLERPKTPEEKLPAPDYVLPTYKTPAKQVDSDEEREAEEKLRVFEYGKASRLLPEVKENVSVPLPSKYLTLLESFQSCDRILSIYSSQGRRCIVSEIQKNVQKNIKRDFNLKHLAQVLHVYPSSYTVKLEEKWHAFGGVTSGKFEHVMNANLKDDLTQYMLPDSPVKSVDLPLPLVPPGKCLSPMKSPRKKCTAPLPRAPEVDNAPRLEGWRMACRGYIMRHLLAEKVKQCYKAFMAKIGGPEPKFPVKRFHPKFAVKMDSECADLEQVILPEPPKKDENLKHMRDFMDSVEVEAKIPMSAVDKAIEELRSPVKSLVSSSTNVPLSPRKFAQIQAAKPKGTMNLLERIRAKEAAKKLAESMRDPETEKKRAVLQRLEQSILRSVLCMYTQKQCRSLELNTVVEKLVYNGGRTLSSGDVKLHLEILCEVAPNYCSIKEVVSRKYLQITEPDFRLLGSIVKEELQRISA